jgi:hypothetical protein
MPYVKLDTGLLDSSLWLAPDQTRLFLAALLMAQPQEFHQPLAVLPVGSTEPTGELLEPGWYGFVPAAGPALVARTMLPLAAGMAALTALCSPDPDSRTPTNQGRRLARIDGGFVVLNYMAYRDRDYSAAERMRRLRARRKAEAPGVTLRRNEAPQEAPRRPASNPPPALARDERAESAGFAPVGDHIADALRANSRNGLRESVTGDVTVTQAEAEGRGRKNTTRVDASPATEGAPFAVTPNARTNGADQTPDQDPNDARGWQACREAYPGAPRSDWITAEHAARQAVATGRATWSELLAGVTRYRDHCARTGRLVANPARWFGAHDEPWKAPWTVPTNGPAPPPPPDPLVMRIRDLVSHVRPPGITDAANAQLRGAALELEQEARRHAEPLAWLTANTPDAIRRLTAATTRKD